MQKAYNDLVGDKCEGIASLTLLYAGGAGADISVDKGVLEYDGDGFYTILPASGKEELESKTKIYIDGNNEEIEIHTSCSQPLDVGDVYGDFTVVSLEKLGVVDQLIWEPIRTVIETLVFCDKMLASVAYEDAVRAYGIVPDDKAYKELVKCEDEFEKAQEELNETNKDGTPDPDYDKAIDHYKHEWEHAQHALDHASD